MSTADTPTTTSLVVMGVSGAGKSTVAELLATRLGWPIAEADRFHSEANIAKMASGIPLTDADRLPWLHAVKHWIDRCAAAGSSTVLACSALKRSYRDVLRESDTTVRFVHLEGSADVLNERLRGRSGHFMPPTLLRSQMDDLEALDRDEDGVRVDADTSPHHIARRALHLLGIER